jgi:DNA-binding MarR family transcriptional regulator
VNGKSYSNFFGALQLRDDFTGIDMQNRIKMETARSTPFSVGDEIRQPTRVSRSIGYAIRRAQMRVYDEFFTQLANLDTTPTRYTLMLLIGENPGIRAVDLARILGVARSRMVKLIDDLESRSLISRQTHHSDRRNQILVLTTQGELKLTQLKQVAERHEAQLTEGLSEDEWERLLGLLWRIALPS